MNIFKLTKEYFEAPKRNVYDLSYTSNLTAKFGYLYPVFIKEVNPGDSMSIQTTFGLRAEPMVFPVQSRMRADIHYFYVRNRTLWTGWMDFYGKLDDTLVHPYINQPAKFYKSGSLADYLGVPTSIVGGSERGKVFSMLDYHPYGNVYKLPTFTTAVSIDTPLIGNGIERPYSRSENPLNPATNNGVYPGFFYYVPTLDAGTTLNQHVGPRTSASSTVVASTLPVIGIDEAIDMFSYLKETYAPSNRVLAILHNSIGFKPNAYWDCLIHFYFAFNDSISIPFYRLISSNQSITIRATTGSNPVTSVKLTLVEQGGANVNVDAILSYLQDIKNIGGTRVLMVVAFSSSQLLADGYDLGASFNEDGYATFGNFCEYVNYKTTCSYDSSDSNLLPWVNNGNNGIKIKLNALPFRAYEAIYNSFYRNYMNDPFMLNGKPQYNRYVTNLDGGSDVTPYSLKKRNWELDFLTSAQQSPQQGEAPLVGITVNNANSTATMKFKSTELETAGVQDGIVTAEVKIDDDTNMIGINYYDKDLPQSNLQRLMEAINYGISINDLRQTTSLQRWLEKNIRRGYRYIDQIKSHFGVNLSYKDLLMPEFIGGCSEIIQTNTISQTTPTSDSPLGAYGGQATVIGQSRNNVSHYCDEAGFIIGIMSIVPTPVYSQVPNQFFYKENVLDYYFPEFGKIGMQPIYNKDITPLQTQPDQLEKVFGYQRPWWHLISSIDEVHGEFRTTRQGYLIQRMFEDTPILNGDFLTIDNNSINNVFYVDGSISDQFLGQLHFQVTKKTAIPLHGIPAIN